MASFGMLPGNNAPLPVFGGTNPTGMMPGGYSSGESFGFPNYPMFGSPNTGIVSPMANLPLFGATNFGGSSSGSGGGMASLSSGFGSNPGTLTQLSNDYGSGIGAMLNNILSNGLFNPQVADAFLNAMQPSYNRGVASIEQAFGAEGARFGSSAALGLGDFSSQFALNEQQTLASMYMQAQQEQLSLLENILPTVHAEQADSQSNSWLGPLLDAIGVVGAPFTGGLSLGLTAIGANMGKGNSGGSSLGMGIPNIGMPNIGMSIPGLSGSGTSDPFTFVQDWMQNEQSQSAGAALGGATSNSPSVIPWM